MKEFVVTVLVLVMVAGLTAASDGYGSIPGNTQTGQTDFGRTFSGTEWSSWESWGSCSQSCGRGSQSRFRECLNSWQRTSPGQGCSTGSNEQSRQCNVQACRVPVDGGWSDWSGFSGCTKTCGNDGTKSRRRTCSQPAPANGGRECVGGDTDFKECNRHKKCRVPVDGVWSDWSGFSSCSKSCGVGGTKSRSRTCSQPAPENGGRACFGVDTDFKDCNKNIKCRVDGEWSDWSGYSRCSESCGDGGSKSRSRTCNQPAPANGGRDCVGEDTDSKECNRDIQCPVDGAWTRFGRFGGCSVTCGGGVTKRTRTCTSPPPSNGGAGCSGIAVDTMSCNTDPCAVPVDGGWSDWSGFSSCTKTCGVGGIKSRSRTCNSPASANGGRDCQGIARETKNCNENVPCQVSVDGGWSDWSGYSSCSKSCGDGGTKSRSRICSQPPPANGGRDCVGGDTDFKECNGNINCQVWSQWTVYSSCTRPCGGGDKFRTRTCEGGDNCQGESRERTSCNTNTCPVDGGWSNWSGYNPCSASCQGGIKSRLRFCTNPTPQNNGAYCQGSSIQQSGCNNDVRCSRPPIPVIPVNGNWGEWTSYTECSKSCDIGGKQRSRQCNNPAPSNGGSTCVGETSQVMTCNVHSCLVPVTPVNGRWSEWGRYNACSVKCDVGVRIRDRTCTNPAPTNGGSQCVGEDWQEKKCRRRKCKSKPGRKPGRKPRRSY